MSSEYGARRGVSDEYRARGGVSGEYRARGGVSGEYEARGGLSGEYGARGGLSGLYGECCICTILCFFKNYCSKKNLILNLQHQFQYFFLSNFVQT